jgi:hypothetical protein
MQIAFSARSDSRYSRVDAIEERERFVIARKTAS